MSDSRQRLSRRLADRFASPYVAGLAEHLTRVQDSILNLHARLDWIEAELREVPKREERIVAEVQAVRGRIDDVATQIDDASGRMTNTASAQQEMMKAIYERAAEQRQRLYELRQSADYEAAFTESAPLVSFVIPTYNRFELLRDRSLPSILAQGYENLEVIVSGDESPPETAQVVEQIDDPRVRFINRTVRGPYPENPQERWLMSGTPPLNDGLAAAKGRWIAILGDDDEVTPEHTAALVAAAQEQRLEHCYGRMTVSFADGGELDWESKFPPAYGHYTLQLAIYHAGLRFFQFEPGDVAYGEPNDWSLARRMVAAGVRFGKIDALVARKYEDRPTPKIDPVDG